MKIYQVNKTITLQIQDVKYTFDEGQTICEDKLIRIVGPEFKDYLIHICSIREVSNLKLNLKIKSPNFCSMCEYQNNPTTNGKCEGCNISELTDNLRDVLNKSIKNFSEKL